MAEPVHTDDATLAAFVRGEIGDEGFSAHLAACPACAGRLGAAARLEIAMFEAAEAMAHPTVVAMPARRKPSRFSWASELALAASLVLGIGLPARVQSDATDTPVGGERIAMSVDPESAVCLLPDDGGSCDEPEEPWMDEALAMTLDPRGFGGVDEGEDGLCLPAADGSDLVCPAET
jgi:anti-sigma factor RsiW